MIPFRFLHTADLHLDSRFAGLAHISPAIRAYLRESTFAALGRLVHVAIKRMLILLSLVEMCTMFQMLHYRDSCDFRKRSKNSVSTGLTCS